MGDFPHAKVQVTACAMVAPRCCRYSASCDQQKASVAVRRDVAALALAAATLLPVVAACSDSGSNNSQSTQSSAPSSEKGHHGPMFPECGGVSDETVTDLTKIR